MIGDWPKDQYAGSGYGSQHGPGIWTQFGPALEKPEWGGVLNFCGMEYTLQWSGFFEGCHFSQGGHQSYPQPLNSMYDNPYIHLLM
jgi:hypothetical protein